MKRHVLQINMGDSHGGAQQLGIDLHNGLKSTWDSTLLVGNKHSSDPTIHEIHSPKILTYANLLFGLEYMLYPNTFWLHTRPEFRQADVVHYHNLHGYYFNLLAFPRLTQQKPAIWSFHDMWPILGHGAYSFDCERCEAGLRCKKHKTLYPKLYTWDSAALLYRIKRHVLLRSQFTIVVTSRWLQNKVEHSFLREKPIQLIHNGIDTKLFSIKNKAEIRARLHLPQDKKIVLFLAVGGLDDPRKGGNYIKELLQRFSKDTDVVFLSIGGSNQNLHATPNLIQVGHISDQNILAEYYNAADVFVSPAIAENLSLTVLGTMACGLPALVFNIGGMPEIVDHQYNGYLAEPNNITDLAHGLHYLLNESNNKQLSVAARKKIEQHFSLDKMVQEHNALYTSVLNLQNK